MAVQIIVDSACDIEAAEAEKLGITILPIKTRFGETEYLDGVTMSHEQFYEMLIESDCMPTTSQVAPYEYEEAFRRVKEQQDTAVCITISAKLSGCFQSANIAGSHYEDCVEIVDSNNVCIGERILLMRAVQLRDEGKSASEIAAVLEEEKKHIRLIALLDTLEYLKKGGRISAAAAIAGSVLSIKPVIAVEDGEVVVLGKARGSKNGNNMLNELIKKEGKVDFTRPCALAYTGLTDNLLRKYMADSAPLYEGKIEHLPISSVGCAIGTYVGPGAIAAAFFVSSES